MTDHPDETPAEAFDRYLTEAGSRKPSRKPQKRWDRSTIILAVVDVCIAVAALTWWLWHP